MSYVLLFSALKCFESEWQVTKSPQKKGETYLNIEFITKHTVNWSNDREAINKMNWRLSTSVNFFKKSSLNAKNLARVSIKLFFPNAYSIIIGHLKQ